MAETGLLKAGRILVLVGAIMSVFGALMLLLVSIGINLIPTESGTDAAVGAFVGILYGVLAAMLIAGAIFGFLSFRSVGEGRIHRAWIQGLVAALLPPVQVLSLVGAILILVSPEHEAERA